ncbi:hypothetical protein AURDEDRAFT_124830 [Auricularia subglabra TFB-10046 SS5]|nr:hypothetical protein AURDEDRAFT_124830 [Auricularia subglabra TFB-10046 SS5]
MPATDALPEIAGTETAPTEVAVEALPIIADLAGPEAGAPGRVTRSQAAGRKAITVVAEDDDSATEDDDDGLATQASQGSCVIASPSKKQKAAHRDVAKTLTDGGFASLVVTPKFGKAIADVLDLINAPTLRRPIGSMSKWYRHPAPRRRCSRADALEAEPSSFKAKFAMLSATAALPALPALPAIEPIPAHTTSRVRPRSPSLDAATTAPAAARAKRLRAAEQLEVPGATETPGASTSASQLYPVISFGPWRSMARSGMSACNCIVAFNNALPDARTLALPLGVSQDSDGHFANAFFENLAQRDRIVSEWSKHTPTKFAGVSAPPLSLSMPPSSSFMTAARIWRLWLSNTALPYFGSHERAHVEWLPLCQSLTSAGDLCLPTSASGPASRPSPPLVSNLLSLFVRAAARPRARDVEPRHIPPNFHLFSTSSPASSSSWPFACGLGSAIRTGRGPGGGRQILDLDLHGYGGCRALAGSYDRVNPRDCHFKDGNKAHSDRLRWRCCEWSILASAKVPGAIISKRLVADVGRTEVRYDRGVLFCAERRREVLA